MYLTKRLNSAVQANATTVPVHPPLNPGELIVIGHLVRQNIPCSIKEIVEQTGLVQSWASKSVQGLRKRGWVVIKPDPADRRITRVSATSQVLQAATAYYSTDASTVLASLLPDATEAELKIVERGLATLAEGLRRNAPSST